ncbi:beta-lactamase family protein [Flavobacteriaceae bacterium]|nr:beta-lactamase family protein [Flavobacteriaceae bacterium]MDB2339974.1 beta-lactamase family protein [Flavobacteriaceae bacterium]
MKLNSSSFLLLFLWSTFLLGQRYFPPSHGAWEKKEPKKFKINSKKLESAIDFAMENEYSGSRDLRIAILKGFAHEPYHKILGPTKKRGGPAGLILKNGYQIASWGDIKRVDMTFSVTKSYLSTVAGLAVDQNLISTKEKVSTTVWETTFDGSHNQQITWEHLLNQSSDWSGTLWGGHDWADRPPKEGSIDDWKNRDFYTPGTRFEYNDVRVNLLAYSLLQVWRKPLPQVLKEHIMDPIGASTTWRWFGYDNSWTDLDGHHVQSVSGGGHSGGGIFINALDHARFGLLFLNKGAWNGKQLISQDWIEKATASSPAQVNYGYMWWLNKKGTSRFWEGVPENVFYAAGFGGNFIVIVPDEELVIVTRWLEPSQIGSFVKGVLDAL